jgi:predicted RNA binding protein YcfA (HicA-like mRNA interferase family)
MKRRELESWLRKHGATRLRHGGNHDLWHHDGREATVPRHREIGTHLGRKICDQLAVPRFPGR